VSQSENIDGIVAIFAAAARMDVSVSRHYIYIVNNYLLPLSTDEYATLRRLSYEQHVPIATLIRDAIDAAFGTNQDGIRPPGRPKKEVSV
jgi:hypothetical protein